MIRGVRRWCLVGASSALVVVGACGKSDSSGDSGDAGSGTPGASSSASSKASGSTGKTSGSTGAGTSGTATSSGRSSASGGSQGGTSSGSSRTSSTSGGGTSSGSTPGDAGGGGDAAVSAPTNVLQYHNHGSRDGVYVDSAFTKAALTSATLKLDTTFDGTGLAAGTEVRASPLYVESGYGGAPTFYVADESDNVYAFDGNTGKLQKTVNLGTGLTREPCGTAHRVGIRGTPAIDLGTGLMILDAATATGTTLSKHTIYALHIADLSTAWSLDVSTLTDPVVGAFAPADHNQRGAVLIVGGVAYVVYGGFIGDCGDYHGWVVGVPLAGPSGAKAWAAPSGDTGIWAPGGASTDGTNVYVATGNPPLTTNTDPNDGVYSFSLIRFQPGPVFSGAGATFSTNTADYWRAVNDTGDDDLGGSGPLVVTAPGQGTAIVQLGKDGREYVLDATKPLGGMASPSIGTATVMKGNITCGPAWASVGGTTYVVMVGNGTANGSGCATGSGSLVVTKLDVTNATTPITSAWCANPGGGGSPIVTTSDGTHDALVWTAGTTIFNDNTGGDGQIHAFDLATGAAILKGSDTFSGVRHFTSPIVVHGRMFLAGDARLYAYKP